MSDATPNLIYHRALRETARGCVLDPWVSRRASPCPGEPDIGLEDMDCGEGALNKFKELPMRIRGVVERVPFKDLSAVREDPGLSHDKNLCGSTSLIDLGAAFSRNNLDCMLACGTLPYGDNPPHCEPIVDDTGMTMLACYGDFDTFDPGITAPRTPSPWGIVVGTYPEPVAPSCPGQASSAGSCVEECMITLNGLYYVGGCWFGQLDTICACGSQIYVRNNIPMVIGCNCCSHIPPGPEPGSSSTSSSSGTPAPTDPCAQQIMFEGFPVGPCEAGTLNRGMTGTARATDVSPALDAAFAECAAASATGCVTYSECGMNHDGCIVGMPFNEGDGYWYVTWWRCCHWVRPS